MTISRSNPRAAPRWALLLALVVGATLVIGGAAMATLNGSNFEGNDANLKVGGPSGGGTNIDWNSFTSATAADDFEFDSQTDVSGSGGGVNDDQYAGGMKHDAACPTLSLTGSVHTKSDFTRFYIAHETKDVSGTENTFLYLAWQRAIQNSDTNSAHASFIFAQADMDDPSNVCANNLTPVRTHADLVVLYDFQGGDTGVPTIGISRWIVAGQTNPSTGTPSAASQCETSTTLPCWNDVVILPSLTGQGAVNHRGTTNDLECPIGPNARKPLFSLGSVVDAHQTGSSSASTSTPAGKKCLGTVEFGELEINLTLAGVFGGQDCVEFGSVHVASRASGNSFDAQLKDLIKPRGIELGRCGGLTIEKVTDPSGGTGFPFTIEGPEFDPDDDTFSLDDGDTKSYDEILAGTYTISEADPGPGYDLTDISCRDGDDELTSPKVVVDLDTFSVDVDLAVSDDITCTFTNTARGTLIVEKVTDPTPDPLATEFGFTATDDADSGLTGSPFTLQDGENEEFSNLVPGTYTVTEDDPSPDYSLSDITCVDADDNTLGSDLVTVDLDTRTVDVDLGAGETVTCTFTNDLQLGRVVVNKTDDEGGLRAGATITITPASNIVEDVIVDPNLVISMAEVADGVFCTDDLTFGDYVVTETSPPDDFAGASPASQDVTVDEVADCEDVDETTTPDATFQNEQLHVVIVIVCHQADDTLAPSDVSDGTTATTSLSVPPDGITEAELCALGGARYEDLDHADDPNLSVDVGSDAH